MDMILLSGFVAIAIAQRQNKKEGNQFTWLFFYVNDAISTVLTEFTLLCLVFYAKQVF